MFFGYPIAATAENWLHECLVEMVVTIHSDLAAGAPAQVWPGLIPVAYRDALSSRRGLRDRLVAYRKAVASLTEEQRQQIATCLAQQNRISELCRCEADCEAINQLPDACHAPIEDLFGFAFSLLTDIGIRDRHYEIIYNGTQYHVCPFCGCEYFDAPGAPREDLDHYLPKSRYPFAATNLHNLAPMGIKCNERYKLAQDILKDAGGNRRRAFEPYTDRKIEISLDNSIPFDGDDGITPRWHIEFVPNGEECTTWDTVFDTRLRITRDVLNQSFNSWLSEFSSWFRSTGDAAPDTAAIIQVIERYAVFHREQGYNDRSFLKTAVFSMIRYHCAAGNSRLVEVVRDLLAPVEVAP